VNRNLEIKMITLLQMIPILITQTLIRIKTIKIEVVIEIILRLIIREISIMG